MFLNYLPLGDLNTIARIEIQRMIYTNLDIRKIVIDCVENR